MERKSKSQINFSFYGDSRLLVFCEKTHMVKKRKLKLLRRRKHLLKNSVSQGTIILSDIGFDC